MPKPTILDFLPAGPSWSFSWEAISEAFPWIRKLHGSTQDLINHAEGDVGYHTFLVVQELVASSEFRSASRDDQFVVFAAALLHDVCKPETRVLDEYGRITNKGHSRMGANEARQILWRMGVEFGVRERICAIIAVHQVPFWLIDQPAWKATEFLLATSLKVENRLLAMLAEADARGRVCADGQRIIDSVALFREMAVDESCYDAPFEFFNTHTRMQFFIDPQHKNPRAELFDTTNPNFTVTLLAGLPASGKSSWITAQTAPGRDLAGQPVVSMDRIRLEMDVRPQDDQGAVRQAALKRARELLAAKQSFIWDALNLNWQRRTPLVSLCNDYGARVRFAYVETSEAEMTARNRDRAARVPDDAVAGLLRKWEPPTLVECHDLVLSIRADAIGSRPGWAPKSR